MQQERSKNCCSNFIKKMIFCLITGLDTKLAGSQEDAAKITPYAYQAVLCPLEKKRIILLDGHFRKLIPGEYHKSLKIQLLDIWCVSQFLKNLKYSKSCKTLQNLLNFNLKKNLNFIFWRNFVNIKNTDDG
jgi:hypothetical protein